MTARRRIGTNVDEVEYRCGHCNRSVTSRYLTGFGHKNGETHVTRPNLLSCTKCGKDSTLYAASEEVQPMPLLGEAVQHLPDDAGRAYTEARIAFSAGAYTACMLMCRNILAYAANHLGSGKQHNFIDYVDYLLNSNQINQTMKDWADDIRQHGNDAAHDLSLRDEEEAAETLMLTKYLLEFVFEVEGERKNTRRSTRSFTIIRGSSF